LFCRIKAAISDVNNSISTLQSSYTNLSNAITGRGSNSSRCLFTNAYPKLGLLTNTLHEVSQTFLVMNENLDSLKILLNSQIEQILINLQSNFIQNSNARKQYEKLSESYENKILSSLSSRNISKELENEICDLRMQTELHRFDYVAKLNQNNCYKKFLLTKVC
jgi:hypothetical protein